MSSVGVASCYSAFSLTGAVSDNVFSFNIVSSFSGVRLRSRSSNQELGGSEEASGYISSLFCLHAQKYAQGTGGGPPHGTHIRYIQKYSCE